MQLFTNSVTKSVRELKKQCPFVLNQYLQRETQILLLLYSTLVRYE